MARMNQNQIERCWSWIPGNSGLVKLCYATELSMPQFDNILSQIAYCGTTAICSNYAMMQRYSLYLTN